MSPVWTRSWNVPHVPIRATEGGHMADASKPGDRQIPLGQRLLERPFLLLVAGLVVMFGFYTIWGLYEILSLPTASLP
jgi:hypothetical protein